MQLTLEDFDCKDTPPDWIPQEKWEDIMALSVLPGSLDSLCINFAQNSSAWNAWYKSDHPEKEPLPLASEGETSSGMASNLPSPLHPYPRPQEGAIGMTPLKFLPHPTYPCPWRGDIYRYSISKWNLDTISFCDYEECTSYPENSSGSILFQ